MGMEPREQGASPGVCVLVRKSVRWSMNSGSYPKKTATDTQVYRIEGMHCGSCVARIEQGLKRAFPDVSDVRVNLVTNQAVLEGGPSPEKVLEAVSQLGYEASLLENGQGKARRNGFSPPQETPKPATTAGLNIERKAQWRLGIAVVLTVPLFVI